MSSSSCSVFGLCMHACVYSCSLVVICNKIVFSHVLVEGEWLSSQHIAACNTLLRPMYPGQNGLQDTCLLEQCGVWASKSEGFVQIIHVSPGHWVCLSNKFSPEGTVDLFDSLHTVPLEDGSTIAKHVASCTPQNPS